MRPAQRHKLALTTAITAILLVPSALAGIAAGASFPLARTAAVAAAGILALALLASRRTQPLVLRAWGCLPGFGAVGEHGRLYQAEALLRIGDATSALAIADAVALRTRHLGVRAAAHYVAARCHHHLQQWDAAVSSARLAAETASDAGDELLAIHSLNLDGAIASSRRDLQDAETAFRDVLERSRGRRWGQRVIEVLAVYNLGWVAWQRHEHGTAAGHWHRTLQRQTRWTRLTTPVSAMASLGLARVDVREGDVGQARARLADARRAFRHYRDVRLDASAALVDATLAMREARFADAEAAAERALAIAKPPGSAAAATLIGLYALAAHRNLPAADAWLERAKRATAGLQIPELDRVIEAIDRDPGVGLEWAADLDVGIELLEKRRRLAAYSVQPPTRV